jgi:phosphate transport system protein
MSTQSRHILGAFEDAISDLNSDIGRMGAIAQISLEHAVQGLLERNPDLCNRAIADDEQVDSLEKEIDREGVAIIVQFGPVARDLRRVISSIRAASSIERISDYAVHVARRAKFILSHPPLPETEAIRGVYVLSVAMLRDAISSFCKGNLEAALAIRGRDSELDREYREFNRRILQRMQENPEAIPAYVDLLFCVRSLERVGDQCVNISEDAVYLLTAVDIRHGGDLPAASPA